MQCTDIDTTNPNLLNYYFKYDLTFLGYFIIQCVMNHRNLIGRSLKSNKQSREGIERSKLRLQPQKSKNINTGIANWLDSKEIQDILRSLSLESNEMAKVYIENYSHEEDSQIDASNEGRYVYPTNSYVNTGRDEENKTVKMQKYTSPIWTDQSLPSKRIIFDYSNIYLMSLV